MWHTLADSGGVATRGEPELARPVAGAAAGEKAAAASGRSFLREAVPGQR